MNPTPAAPTPPDDAAALGAAVTANAAVKQADVIAQIGAMSVDDQAKLNELGGAIDSEVQAQLSAKTQRALGAVLVVALTSIAGGVMVLLAILSKTASTETFKDIVAAIQPGTVLIAVITSIAGIAAGIGLKDRK